MGSLASLLRPASIAVIGASPRSFIGRAALENLRASGYRGAVVPVNPGHSEVGGFAAAADVRDLEAPIDVALVQVGAHHIAQAVDGAVEAGIRNFVIPGAGHTDSGSLADELGRHLRAVRDSHGIEVVGPNSMGVVDLVSGAHPWVGTVPREIRPGGVGVVSQSGAVAEALVNSGGRIPFSTVISSGAEAATDLADYLEFFADDEATEAVLLFIESMQRPRHVLQAIGRCEAHGKRVAALVVGRSERAREGIVSHSGRLAPDHRVTCAALTQAGAVLAEDLDQLLALGELFGAGIKAVGSRAVFTVNSGGEGNLISDIAVDAGLSMPALSERAIEGIRTQWADFSPSNPIDPWGAADYEKIYPAVLREVAAEEDVDLVVVSHDQQTTCGNYEKQLGMHLARYLRDACVDAGKTPIFLSPASHDPPRTLSDYCYRNRIALLRGARPSLRAIASLAQRVRPRAPASTDASSVPDVSSVTWVRRSGMIEEDDALALLAEAGVDTPRRYQTRTREDAHDAARALGYPVVVKGAGAEVAHKTELGLVHTGIIDPEALDHALDAVDTTGRAIGRRLQYLLAEQVRGALELVVGFHRDPSFGPTVVVGLGGIWAEALDTAGVHVGPIDAAGVHALLDRSGIAKLLDRSRGGALAVDRIVDTVIAVSAVGNTFDPITGIDLNPVIVGRDRAVAVDALITIAPETEDRRQE
jgi:acyl-CoA synthetase (NDP forming)